MMQTDELEKILGYPPSRETKLQIMNYARNNNLTPGEAASKFAMPVMLFINEDGKTYDYEGEKLTPDQLNAKYPFHRFVLIRS